jgi:hypothetical protein
MLEPSPELDFSRVRHRGVSPVHHSGGIDCTPLCRSHGSDNLDLEVETCV